MSLLVLVLVLCVEIYLYLLGFKIEIEVTCYFVEHAPVDPVRMTYSNGYQNARIRVLGVKWLCLFVLAAMVVVVALGLGTHPLAHERAG